MLNVLYINVVFFSKYKNQENTYNKISFSFTIELGTIGLFRSLGCLQA